jgi:hypothetical protein
MARLRRHERVDLVQEALGMVLAFPFVVSF